MCFSTQGNGCDCGLFILSYTELFIRDFVLSPPRDDAVQRADAALSPLRMPGGTRRDVEEAAQGDVDMAAAPWLQRVGPQWFSASSVDLMRDQIKQLLLTLEAEQTASAESKT